jgi:Ca2+-binding EF-hand superfamily protein
MEFLAATIDVSKFLTAEKFEAIFKTFDVNNTGELTFDNI